ncbi:hypothetical protein WBG78_22840 [Chryseolinea sp. T2]|uniref:hypothetical protein n=1 Tax=Chryseolinea sp. T2 TaxID=3129255 RepID=UPI003077B40F
MKKVVCILLVALHLINLVGGYWIFYALQQQTRATLAGELDLDMYAGSQAILIKLPLVDPVSDKENYERVDGEFEYNGTVYRMVKQKFYKDTVYIVCYKDDTSIALKDALQDYVKTFTDTPSGNKQESKFDSLFIKDYLHQGKVKLTVHFIAINIVNHTVYLNGYTHQYDFAIDHPPQLIS